MQNVKLCFLHFPCSRQDICFSLILLALGILWLVFTSVNISNPKKEDRPPTVTLRRLVKMIAMRWRELASSAATSLETEANEKLNVQSTEHGPRITDGRDANSSYHVWSTHRTAADRQGARSRLIYHHHGTETTDRDIVSALMIIRRNGQLGPRRDSSINSTVSSSTRPL